MPKAFPPEFRRDVIAVARKGEAPLAQIAKDFGVSASCLKRWLAIADRELSERAATAVRLRNALDAAAGLPLADIEQVNVLLNAGELQIALETLCTQAYEYDIEISSALGDALLELGTVLDVPVGYLLGDPWADAPDETK